jgi:hypothetical protein
VTAGHNRQPQPTNDHKEITVNHTTRRPNPVRRLAGVLAGLAATLLAAAAAAPAAFAGPVPPGEGGGGLVPPPLVRTVVVGGMPGWQIVLIAVAAGIVAAAVALFLDRVRADRRHQPAPSA